jgi:Na+:H+ antiporter, NhaA family
MLRRLTARPRSAMRQFLRSEAAGGILLILAATLALIVANSPLADAYFHILHIETGPELSRKLGPMTVHLWINDGLMSLFFLLVGLEIKREFLDGHLSSWADRRLPFIAAAAGMAVPALVYLAVTGGDPALSRGWAIPAATDIAFALGLLALLGKRAPTSLKLFLTTVAIVDDVGAVAIIAAFYTVSLDFAALGASLAVLAGMFAMNRGGVKHPGWYFAAFVLLWYFELLSGVHATVAGVLAAMAVPIVKTPAAPDAEDSTLHRMEHALHPWIAFGIVPLFGFANAGVSLAGGDSALSPLPLAIMFGLFVGKQAGIFGSVWIAVKLRLAMRPANASWAQVYGVSLLCGIGFTMSLFIGGLAFPQGAQADAVKIGVLAGSLLSALAGLAVLRFAPAFAKAAETG